MTFSPARTILDDRPEVGGCCGPKYRCATQIHVLKAVGLEKQDRIGGKYNNPLG